MAGTYKDKVKVAKTEVSSKLRHKLRKCLSAVTLWQ